MKLHCSKELVTNHMCRLDFLYHCAHVHSLHCCVTIQSRFSTKTSKLETPQICHATVFNEFGWRTMNPIWFTTKSDAEIFNELDEDATWLFASPWVSGRHQQNWWNFITPRNHWWITYRLKFSPRWMLSLLHFAKCEFLHLGKECQIFKVWELQKVVR